MQDDLKKHLFELFGDLQETGYYQFGHICFTTFISDKFSIVAEKYNDKSSVLIRAGLIHPWTTDKDFPVNFWLHENISRRKKRRVQQCLNFLLRTKENDYFYHGEIFGFDDLGRAAAYKTFHKKL